MTSTKNDIAFVATNQRIDQLIEKVMDFLIDYSKLIEKVNEIETKLQKHIDTVKLHDEQI